jgi:hypothetical protein
MDKPSLTIRPNINQSNGIKPKPTSPRPPAPPSQHLSKDEAMAERNPHYIGEGEYLVYYKEPIQGKAKKFIGICENFNTNGICAFWNKEKDQMLLVVYWDILGLYPAE